MKKKYLIWLILIWTSIIIASFAWNSSLIISNNRKVVLNKSQAFFKQILITREWNSNHGGVYVPITATTKTNPYLNDTLRDIVTIDGMQLTKVNPSYMTRQIAEIDKKDFDIQVHITSLHPIRPANKPDQWETKALNSLKNNNQEVLELVKDNSSARYRYMAPLMTSKSCLKCHADQGYQYGDIRGGISVSFPSAFYTKGVTNQLTSFATIHLLILALGILGLTIYYRMANSYYSIVETKNNELMQINAAKDKFFSIIAHDLRSPFNIILGYIDLLKSQEDTLNKEERKEIIDEIDQSSKSAFVLLEDLLLWAKSQSNRIELTKEFLNLRELVIEAIEAHLPGAKRKNIQVYNKVPENLSLKIDEFTIKTVIANLFDNAIKFTPSMGKIEIKATRKDNSVEVSISDNGVGISPETIPQLFLIEEGISTLGTQDEKGSGLGLLLCKEFVDKHNGKIWVESELSKGSTFTFSIPASSQPEQKG